MHLQNGGPRRVNYLSWNRRLFQDLALLRFKEESSMRAQAISAYRKASTTKSKSEPRAANPFLDARDEQSISSQVNADGVTPQGEPLPSTTHTPDTKPSLTTHPVAGKEMEEPKLENSIGHRNLP